ncbi:LuxR family two component transcriptional regulator [Mucilaginibacter yixingensis]|uniref:LuxR family two component transcriptional regulator n=1 Tax=Mucilaginibacter yixingensis TaxID=1295612 RepID=A0A2T5JBJ2_9SPHI|nr:response regulator transcription factor [Mucilaginibacter yixingensis]PTQ98233.1 LuxR family two component transcriptional regulator [Mucilaginibacter yixingensis]
MNPENVAVAIADDHQLFLKSLSMLVSGFAGFHVVAEAINGKELIDTLEKQQLIPDIVLLDVNMQVMNGEDTAKHLSKKLPKTKIIALSMQDDSYSIINMLKAGCCAYLLKDIHPDELEKALNEVYANGFYNADAANVNFRRLLKYKMEDAPEINEREKRFLQLASSDATYKQIASEMCLSERTIDGYREALFRKFNVQSRVGLVLEALRRNIVQLGEAM